MKTPSLMSHNGTTTWFDGLAATVSLVVCLWAAGCASLLKETPVAKAYFAIDPGLPEISPGDRATTQPIPEVLRVRTLRVSPPYDGTAFVYRIGPSQFDTDYEIFPKAVDGRASSSGLSLAVDEHDAVDQVP